MRISLIVATVILLWATFVHSEEPATDNVHTVERFVAAFNAHDSESMAEFVSDDVAWLSINGKDVAEEVTGKNELVASMNAYFKSCPTCQSELSGTISTSGRVSAIETASWQSESGTRSQRSISVYEFSDGLIQRVFYFSSERSD